VYQGDYDEYLVQREARRELLEAQARNQAKRVAEIERFIERFRYKASKARQVQSRIKMLDRMERVEVERDARGIRFGFPQPPRTGRRVATLRSIHKAYGDNVVYADVDFEVERGMRVAFVGPNGAGKSRMLVRPAALLCLDEPTNHLDLASREVLEGALAAFPGTIVFISHDRYFINRIATSIVEITRGSLVVHQGNYDDYLAAKTRAAAEATAERDVRGG